MSRITDTLMKDIVAAYDKGGEEQVVIVKKRQAELMTEVTKRADELALKYGMELPDAMAAAFDLMYDQQKEYWVALDGIQNDFLHKQIEAYLEGGEAQVALTKEAQAKQFEYLTTTANSIHKLFGVDMPTALAEATKQWDKMAEALNRAKQEAYDLTVAAWKANPNQSPESAADIARKIADSMKTDLNGMTYEQRMKHDADMARAKEMARQWEATHGGTPTPMAAGGIVTRPTIALIGEAGKEAVIPLDRLGQFGGGGHHIEVHVDARGQEDPEAIADAVARAVDRQLGIESLQHGV